MNKRIKELEKQATETVKCGLNGASTTESFNRKKFAELIIRDVVFIMTEQYDENPPWGHVEQIRDHFGIKDE